MAALLALAGSCHAQSSSATPDQEYQKLIQVDQNVEPLGEHPFGENISTYDGSVSFNVTDVSLRGNGPTITVARTSQFFQWVPQGTVGPQLPLGNWDLDIPRIETLVGTGGAVASSAIWQTGVPGAATTGTIQRCTTFTEPPGIASTLSEGGWVPDEWWYGYNLMVPGEGKQLLMPRYSANSLSPTISGMSFPIVTKNNWMIGCGVTASDGGEGFLAIAPDGTRYTFAHLLYRPYYPIIGAGGPLPPDGINIAAPSTSSAQNTVSAKTNGTTQTATPMVGAPGGVGILARQDAFMYVTQIQDRFGNTLTYNYDPSTGYLTSITANDGREVDITYVSGTPLIYTITAKATNVPSRTWTYSYDSTTSLTPSLTGVQLPDGSAWSYQLNVGPEDMAVPTSNCQLNQLPAVPYPVTGSSVGTVTAPSGLKGTFYFGAKLSGRSYTPKECYGNDNGTAPISLFPEWYVQPAITSEVLSGAGMTTQTWTYSYSPANASWSSDVCASDSTCATTVYTDVTDPNGNDTRYTYSNRYDATEAQLLRTDTYSGAYGGTLVRSETNTYANASAGPWPSTYGIDLLYRDNYFQVEQLTPLQMRQTTEEGDTYTWQVMAFNAYAQPTDVKRYNSINGQLAIEETTAYLNDPNLWVLGLTQTITNVTPDLPQETELSNTYNGQDLLKSRARFGEQPVQYTWNSAGQLASFMDGDSNTTNLSNYYRGIPQEIDYPDGGIELLVVDDLGQITSITDQNGNVTQYNYDPIGRIAKITYPTNGTVSWYPKVFTYSFVGSERGITGSHWDRTTTMGNAVTTTYFDADLRPILSDASNGSQDITTATSYDWTGATTFASYPVYGQPAINDSSISTGTHNSYDPLQRLIQRQEDSELGALTTSTVYLGGAGKQVTDPRNKVTTTYYQVFDEPRYKDPIFVNAPAGITQTIVRNIYGDPTSVTQSGAYGSEYDSITKTLVYDSNHRLCRTTEPESGSTVIAYDSANNVQWSAQGQTITDGSCGLNNVVSEARTVRTYDPMNRVETITPPAGTQATSYTYDAVGNVKAAISGFATDVYAYDPRNMLTSQVLSIGNHSWKIGYTYDGYEHLSSISYPERQMTLYNGNETVGSDVINYQPDALGRPTQAGNYAEGVTYFPNGELAVFNLGNGASYVAEQNDRQFLQNFSYGVGSTLNLSEDFSYDNNGNIVGIQDLVNGERNKAFTYDELDRLKSATASGLYGAEFYTYDALNNLRSRTVGDNTLVLNYNTSNQLESVSEGGGVISSYGYDAQGNRNSLTSNGATTNYQFDAENQLLQIPGLEGYAYDAAGRRTTKSAVNSMVSTYYFYDRSGHMMFQFDQTTGNATNYVYLGKKLIARHTYSDTVLEGSATVEYALPFKQEDPEISGWACATSLDPPINIDVYIGGGASNGGTFFGRFMANQTPELPNQRGSASANCGNGNYSFGIPITADMESQFGGEPIYVYAVSPFGAGESVIGQTQVPQLPPTIPASPSSVSIAVSTNPSSITASWPNVSGAKTYQLSATLTVGGSSETILNTTVYANSYTVSNPPGGSYTAQVQACNQAGCSAATTSAPVSYP